MPTPRFLYFDLGMVMVTFSVDRMCRQVSAAAGLDGNRVSEILFSSGLQTQYELGQITTRQFFDEVRAATGFTGSAEEFGEFFADIFTPIPSMVELHAAVRQRKIPTCIFSNTNELAISHIRRRFPFFTTFDGYVLSYEHGWLKPDSKLYEVVERETRRRGAEILYLDDRPENIAAGADRGWQTVLCDSPEAARSAVHRRGLLNHD